MKRTNKKLNRMLAVILTLTMLMSAMMVQAFAAVKPETEISPFASGTLQGYNVSATIGALTAYNKFNCYTTSDVNMAVFVSYGHVNYRTSSGSVKTCSVNSTASYYGYSLTIPVTVSGALSSYTAVNASLGVSFGYNGMNCIVSPTRTF